MQSWRHQAASLLASRSKNTLFSFFFSSPLALKNAKEARQAIFCIFFLSGSCIIIIIYCPRGDCTGVSENLALPFKLLLSALPKMILLQ